MNVGSHGRFPSLPPPTPPNPPTQGQEQISGLEPVGGVTAPDSEAEDVALHTMNKITLHQGDALKSNRRQGDDADLCLSAGETNDVTTDDGGGCVVECHIHTKMNIRTEKTQTSNVPLWFFVVSFGLFQSAGVGQRSV